jgi:hypothetical protein
MNAENAACRTRSRNGVAAAASVDLLDRAGIAARPRPLLDFAIGRDLGFFMKSLSSWNSRVSAYQRAQLGLGTTRYLRRALPSRIVSLPSKSKAARANAGGPSVP